MFNYTQDDLVRCPHCGNLLPDYEMDYTDFGELICSDCKDIMEDNND